MHASQGKSELLIMSAAVCQANEGVKEVVDMGCMANMKEWVGKFYEEREGEAVGGMIDCSVVDGKDLMIDWNE